MLQKQNLLFIGIHCEGDSNNGDIGSLLLGRLKIKRKWKPDNGGTYYAPNFFENNLCEEYIWRNDDYDNSAYQRGVVCRTEEEAKELARKMLYVVLKGD